MKNKKIITILVAICGIALIIALFLLGDKNLDINSNEITELYSKLGEVDINHCGGLFTYGDEDISLDNANKEYTLCMAYHQIKKEDIAKKKADVTGKNESKTNICKIGETTLSTEDNKTECEYEEFDVKKLEEAYNGLYGSKISEGDSFYTSTSTACYKEGEKYICGEAETYKIAISPESNIYRVINKAIKKLNGTIIIEDTYLKISNKACYTKPGVKDKNEECSKFLEDKDINALDEDTIINLVNKYGTKYEHTFKENNKNHYWFETKIK